MDNCNCNNSKDTAEHCEKGLAEEEMEKQVEFLTEETDKSENEILWRLRLTSDKATLMSRCVSIAADEILYSKRGDKRYNQERRNMALTVLESYGYKETADWLRDTHDNSETKT